MHYDLAITQHVQQKDTITTKYPPLQKQEEKNVVENTSSLKFPILLGTGDDKRMVRSDFLPHWQEMLYIYSIILLRIET